MEQNGLIELLVAKYPDYKPEWSTEVSQAWFAGFERLVWLVVERAPAAVMVAGIDVPAAVPVVAAPASSSPIGKVAEAASRNGNGHTGPALGARGAVGPALIETMRKVAAGGGTNREAAALTGLPESTVSYYMQRLRKEVGTARKSPAPAAFRDAGGDGAVGHADGDG